MSDLPWSYILIVPLPLGLLVGALMLVWWERRVLAWWQDRLGPNRVGWFGVLQAVADLIKLLTKDDWIPPFGDRFLFLLAPFIVAGAMLMAFAVIPFDTRLYIAESNIALLWFLAMSSMAVYGVLLGGLASNNKYALLGGLRAAAQMVTYEVFMALSILGVVMLAGSFSLTAIVESQEKMWHVVPQCLGLVIFIIAGLAETHRLPFDLPEAEHELTAGFHTEYSGLKFGLIMAAEYIALILLSCMITLLFFGGWHAPDFGRDTLLDVIPGFVWFGIKVTVFIHFFILLRAAIPRPRYDQLMTLGWKILLPLSLINLLVTGGVMLAWGD